MNESKTFELVVYLEESTTMHDFFNACYVEGKCSVAATRAKCSGWLKDSLSVAVHQGSGDMTTIVYTLIDRVKESYPNLFSTGALDGVAQHSLLKQLTKTEEQPVNKTFETKHFVNGTNIAKLSFDQMVEAIASLEQKIKTLKRIKVDSKAIKKQIKVYKADIASIVSHLDART